MDHILDHPSWLCEKLRNIQKKKKKLRSIEYFALAFNLVWDMLEFIVEIG